MEVKLQIYQQRHLLTPAQQQFLTKEPAADARATTISVPVVQQEAPPQPAELAVRQTSWRSSSSAITRWTRDPTQKTVGVGEGRYTQQVVHQQPSAVAAASSSSAVPEEAAVESFSIDEAAGLEAPFDCVVAVMDVEDGPTTEVDDSSSCGTIADTENALLKDYVGGEHEEVEIEEVPAGHGMVNDDKFVGDHYPEAEARRANRYGRKSKQRGVVPGKRPTPPRNDLHCYHLRAGVLHRSQAAVRQGSGSPGSARR